jgi:hypothetical protein
MSQPTSLSAGSALGRQTCFVKHNINLSACSALGRQTCRPAHEDFCLKNWAIDCNVTQVAIIKQSASLYCLLIPGHEEQGVRHFLLIDKPAIAKTLTESTSCSLSDIFLTQTISFFVPGS